MRTIAARRARNEDGTTLVEILVALVVLGIIVPTVFITQISLSKSRRETADFSDVNTALATAVAALGDNARIEFRCDPTYYTATLLVDKIKAYGGSLPDRIGRNPNPWGPWNFDLTTTPVRFVDALNPGAAWSKSDCESSALGQARTVQIITLRVTSYQTATRTRVVASSPIEIMKRG